MKKFLLLQSLLLLAIVSRAQTLPGSYTTTWAGNTFSGSTDWVQGYMLSAAVSPEGKVVTIAHWDEAHKECGIYQDGQAIGRINVTGYVIAGNQNHVFIPSGNSVKKYTYTGVSANQTINTGINPDFLAANKNYLAVVENESNAVELYNLSTGNLVKKWSVFNPGAVAIDSNNYVWVVSGVKLPEGRFERKWLVYDSTYTPRICKYNIAGTKQTDSVQLYKNWRPACLAIDNNSNQLMIGDDGPKHQINFYDIENTPILKTSFGTEGGLSGENAGIITPTTFGR